MKRRGRRTPTDRDWRARRDVDDEFRAHLEYRIDDLIADGLDPDEARRRALAEFGDRERLEAECLETGASRPGTISARAGRLDRLRHDLAFAVRQLRRDPGFAAMAVLTLGLGLAATTSIFAVVDAVVLAPLPFAEPERVVYVEEVTPAGQTFSVSEPTFLDWQNEAVAFASIGAVTGRGATLQNGDAPRSVSQFLMSASLLPTLGVEPLIGRGFSDAEDRPGAPAPVAMLGHELWLEAFGGDRGVVGADVVLDGRSFQVVGVLPPELLALDGGGVFTPLGASPTLGRDDHYLEVWARLAPGATLEGARREMTALTERLGRLHPADAGWSAQLQPAHEVLVGRDLARAGWVLVGGAGLLLLIACVNVSNLLLARAGVRRTELAVRSALGAGRARISAQLLTESAVLAALGGAVGVGASVLALPAVRALGEGRVPRLENAALSPTVWFACLGATVLAAVAFGLAPVFEVRSGGEAGALRSARQGGRGARRFRAGLVVGQMALSVVLLVGTGLLVRSFTRLAAVDPGFDPRGTVTARLNMPDASIEAADRATLLPRLLSEIAALPDVEAVGATAVDPFSGQNLMNFVARHDRMPADARDFAPVSWRVVTAGFFDAMDLEVLAGRPFLATDDTGWDGQPVVIGASLARQFWPEAESDDEAAARAVGETIVWGDPTGTRLTVVGVVEDLNDWRLAEQPFPVVYRDHRQIPWSVMTLVARVRGDAGAVAAGMRRVIRAEAPGLAVPETRTLEWHMRQATAEPRFHALLMAVFAVAGLTLALVGVYGVTAFSVSRRAREIGIRLALGGDPADVRRMVLAESARLALAGAVVGTVGAWGAGRLLASLLFETAPWDLLTWSGVLAMLVVGALAAAWFPARRATKVDPREVLTAE